MGQTCIVSTATNYLFPIQLHAVHDILDMYINVVTMMEIMKYKEEYLVTDANFLGGIGGSLGLFLGFSCYGVFSYMVDNFFDRIFTKTK